VYLLCECSEYVLLYAANTGANRFESRDGSAVMEDVGVLVTSSSSSSAANTGTGGNSSSASAGAEQAVSKGLTLLRLLLEVSELSICHMLTVLLCSCEHALIDKNSALTQYHVRYGAGVCMQHCASLQRLCSANTHLTSLMVFRCMCYTQSTA
jgi:hypothetical protein